MDRLLNFQAFATKLRLLTLTFVIGTAGFAARAQQTVFSVPSADVLDKGKTYYEWDATLGDNAPSLAFTPRSVYGLGHGIESGINISSFNTPNPGTVAVVSATKWEFFESKPLGLAFFAGDHIFLPIDRRNYAVGNSAYIAAAKTFARTRISGGIYDFSAHVIDRANRAGIQASIEQSINPRLTLATDWYSGSNSMGFVTSGLACKISTFTVYTAYEMGNHGLLSGNHSILLVLGWNPDFHRAPR